MEDFWVAVAWSLIPTIVVVAIGYMILRGILRFDRNERRVYSQIEAQERARRGLPPKNS